MNIRSMGRTVDCADPDESCIISIAEADSVAATVASRGISFAPPGPPPATRGSISVDPATGLRDGTDVTVKGTGFRPNVGVIVSQCFPELRDPTDCAPYYELVGTDETGAFTATFFYLFRVFHSRLELRTDCAVDRCVIAAGESRDFPSTVATTPLTFLSPDEMPSATVTPDHDLHDGQVVTEGNNGTTLLEIPVRLSFACDHPVTISWATFFDSRWSDVAARPGVDYTAANGVITFAPGETEQKVPISVIGDVTAEGDELLVFGIYPLTNARVAGPWGRLGVGGIIDDD